MSGRLKYIFCVILLLINGITINNIFAQTKKELEEQKRITLEEIENATNLLKETQATRKENIGQIQIINGRINLRGRLIKSIESETRILEEEIDEKSRLVTQMEQDLEALKKEYEKLILFSYKNRNKYDRIIFLFSAENFNQAYKRLRYIKQFVKFRRKQSEVIINLQEKVKKEITDLEDRRKEKVSLAEEKKKESNILQKEVNQKSALINQLKKKESELRKEIAEKNKISERIENEIAEIIAAEAKRMKNTDLYKQLTPEERLISNNFMENKGRLPWPTEKGVITEHFGVHPHAVLKGITIENNGVDIVTIPGAEARALFEGVVSKVIAILGANYTVIIRHGNYLTVYQNLVNVKVKKGDNVKLKQSLGTIYTDKETNITMLHIEIWKELQKQNPEEWLSKL
jgi:septal ring factor EnvC (AmiA/AmiB activator)